LEIYVCRLSGSESWQVIGQWHVQPDWKSGETWGKWSGHGKNPPLWIEYDDGFVATYRNEEKYPFYKKKIEFGEWIHLVSILNGHLMKMDLWKLG